MPGQGGQAVAVGVPVEAVSVAEEEANGLLLEGRRGYDGDMVGEAIVDVCRFEEEVR